MGQFFSPVYAPFYASVCALAGVVLGVAVSYSSARKQREIDVLTKGRQRWLDALREDLADLYAARQAYDDKLKPGYGDAQSESAQDALFKLRLLRARVLLRLDEVRKRRREGRPQIGLGLTVRAFSDENGTLTPELSERLINDGQAVIDAAWEKVKRLE